MKAFYEVETLTDALNLAKKFNDKYAVWLVQNVYESDSHINSIVIKYNRV